MKKIGMCIGILCGCSVQSPPPAEASFRIVSTTAMVDDIVAKIAGEGVCHEVLIQGEIDPHSYELRKGDDEKIDEADLVFYSGLNLEHGASLRAKLLDHPHAVSVGEYVMQHYGDLLLWQDGQVDPHIWMDASIWAKIVEPIVEALSLAHPEEKDLYYERGEKVKEQLLVLHKQLQTTLSLVPSKKRYLVTSHDAFGYFARRYLAEEQERALGTWRLRFAAPEGLSPDGQLGIRDLQEIMDHLLRYEIQVVFPESNVNRDSLRKIIIACQEQKATVRFSQEPLFGDCMGPQGTVKGTYEGMLTHNAEVLVREWTP